MTNFFKSNFKAYFDTY
jgi:hypothetical protein